MKAVLEKTMSVEDYIQYELKAERRHEFINGQLFEMPGEKDTNIQVSNFLTFYFFLILQEKGYEIYPHEMKVAIPGEDKYYYPDWLITAEPMTDANQYIKYHPELIVEVVSKTSYINDTVNKFIDYTKIPSLKYYLVVKPAIPAITVYSQDDTGEWGADEYTAQEDVISFPLLSLELPVKEMFKIIQKRQK